MFENSIFNKIEFYCLNHPKNKITHVCIDIQCPANPLLCSYCLSDYDTKNKHFFHQKSLKLCSQGFNEIGMLINKDKGVMEKIYKNSIGKKQNDLLIRSIQQKQRHYISIQRHINSIKYQVEQQIANLYKIFEKCLQQSKKIIFSELESFCKIYSENFQIFSNLIDPLVAYHRSYKYFCNANNISLKLMTEQKKKGINWLSDLKNLLNFTQKINSNPKQFQANLEKSLFSMNSMLNSLPIIDFRQQDSQEIMKASLLQTLRSGLKLCQLKPLNNILVPENVYIDAELKKKKTMFNSEQRLKKNNIK